MGRDWSDSEFGHTLGNTLLAPNPAYYNCNMESWGGDFDAPGMYNMSSFHPGGANAAFADGSVRVHQVEHVDEYHVVPRFERPVARSSRPTVIESRSSDRGPVAAQREAGPSRGSASSCFTHRICRRVRVRR